MLSTDRLYQLSNCTKTLSLRVLAAAGLRSIAHQPLRRHHKMAAMKNIGLEFAASHIDAVLFQRKNGTRSCNRRTSDEAKPTAPLSRGRCHCVSETLATNHLSEYNSNPYFVRQMGAGWHQLREAQLPVKAYDSTKPTGEAYHHR